MRSAKRDYLEADRIKANLKTSRIGREILVFDVVSSTNDAACGYVGQDGGNDGLVIFAEEQSAGRGRGGSRWFGGKGDSILCSVVLAGSGLGAEIICLVSAVAVADAVGSSATGKVAGSAAKVKWPNDVYMNARKVAGVLVESRQNKRATNYIVGVGINCHQQRGFFSSELQDKATSIDIESGSFCDRVMLARRLLVSLEKWTATAKVNPEQVIEYWQHCSICLGHRVKLLHNGRTYSGNCIGMEPGRGLIVQLDSGGVRMFEAAHTSVVNSV